MHAPWLFYWFASAESWAIGPFRVCVSTSYFNSSSLRGLLAVWKFPKLIDIDRWSIDCRFQVDHPMAPLCYLPGRIKFLLPSPELLPTAGLPPTNESCFSKFSSLLSASGCFFLLFSAASAGQNTEKRAIHPHVKTSTKEPDDVIWTKYWKQDWPSAYHPIFKFEF